MVPALLRQLGLAYVVLTAAVTASMALYGWRVQRYESERAAAKLDRAVGEGRVYSILLTLAGVALLAIFAGGRNELLGLYLPAGVPRLLGTVGLAAGFVGLLALGTLCWYAPLAYARVAATETERTVPDLLGMFGRTLLVYSGMLVVPLTAWLTPQFGAVGVLATLAVQRALYHVFRPGVTRFRCRTRPSTTDERDRLEAASAATEFEPSAICVVESDRAVGTGTSYDGLPRRRTVFTTDSFLSAADDTQLRAAFTQLDSLRQTGFIERRTAIVSGGLLACAWLLSPLSPVAGLATLLVFAVVVAGAVVLLWRLSLQIYRADSTAADRVGARELVALTEWWLEECGEDESTHGRLTTVLTSQPPQNRRLDRLRERFDDPVEPSADDTNPAD